MLALPSQGTLHARRVVAQCTGFPRNARPLHNAAKLLHTLGMLCVEGIHRVLLISCTNAQGLAEPDFMHAMWHAAAHPASACPPVPGPLGCSACLPRQLLAPAGPAGPSPAAQSPTSTQCSHASMHACISVCLCACA
eukprot:1159968-Pelagomonas_calceolata.AAC.4